MVFQYINIVDFNNLFSGNILKNKVWIFFLHEIDLFPSQITWKFTRPLHNDHVFMHSFTKNLLSICQVLYSAMYQDNKDE